MKALGPTYTDPGVGICRAKGRYDFTRQALLVYYMLSPTFRRTTSFSEALFLFPHTHINNH